MTHARSRAWTIIAAVTPLVLSACGQGNEYKEPPPPKVMVAQPIQQQVQRYLEANGNTASVNSTDLVARVPGFVEKVPEQDGAAVTKGTLLFTIEPEPYRIKLEQAKAAQAGAEANLKDTQATYQRQADLLSRNVSTQANYDQALAARDQAQANLDQAKANTSLAQTNLEYTQVTAPFDGIVTARQVSLGQYVGGSATPTVLASIVQFRPIWANFNVAEPDVQRIRAEFLRRGLSPAQIRNVPVEIGLQTETGYPHHGTLDYAAPTVDSSTGTLAARGIFENADRVLLPGYFVRVRVPQGEPSASLLVPDTALGSDQAGRYLLVVNKDNLVEQHKVEVGPQVDTLRVIESGIKADDRVIVGGLLRAIPGQKVDPQTQTASSAPAPGNAR
jgi:RND family efflux transporter MFP subunit